MLVIDMAVFHDNFQALDCRVVLCRALRVCHLLGFFYGILAGSYFRLVVDLKGAIGFTALVRWKPLADFRRDCAKAALADNGSPRQGKIKRPSEGDLRRRGLVQGKVRVGRQGA